MHDIAKERRYHSQERPEYVDLYLDAETDDPDVINSSKFRTTDQIGQQRRQDTAFDPMSAGDANDYKSHLDKIASFLSEFPFYSQMKNIFSNSAPKGRVQTVYTTAAKHRDIKERFPCLKSYDESTDKSGAPCNCRNCAVVGILEDSQKRPFATEALTDPTETSPGSIRSENRRHQTSQKGSEIDGARDCRKCFRIIASKIRRLEARLVQQEEDNIRKDDFKKVIKKILSRFVTDR